VSLNVISEFPGLIVDRNGRIPPLPRGYSQALTSVIKSMLNLNVSWILLYGFQIFCITLNAMQPAMRPSAAQLLQHERVEFIFNVAETEKMSVPYSPFLNDRS
jgi:NIMA (never in mitosis gene a)-related kinase 2